MDRVISILASAQPRSQGLLRFQDGGREKGSSLGRHLESGVDPGNEVEPRLSSTW